MTRRNRTFITKGIAAGAAYALIVLALASCQTPAPKTTTPPTTAPPITTPKEIVLYYDVPLICMVVPDIGCGPAAKPILVELQKRNGVQEVWLNRTGTVLAVVGSASIVDSSTLTKTADQFFRDKNVHATIIRDRDYLNSLAPRFREEGKWYRGTLVDLLSVEEARRVAVNALGHIQDARLLSGEEAQTVKSDIDIYFDQEANAVRANGERTTSDEQWYAEMINILAKHVGKERAEAIRKFHEEHLAR